MAISNAASFGSNTVTFASNGTKVVALANMLVTNTYALTGNGTMDVATNIVMTNSGAITGAGGLTKSGTGTVVLSASNNYSGTTTVSAGVLSLANTNALSGSTLDYSSAGRISFSNLTGANLGGLQGSTNLALTNASGGVVALNVGGNNSSTTYSGALSGGGGLTKSGTGTLTLSGANTYTGSAIVSAGTLNVANTTGSALGSVTNVSVSSGATLLVSQSNQVNNAATVSLSGGTIRIGTGVTETFGNLNVSSASFLDFGATFGNANTINFGTYTPSALLTINNFDYGSTLTFKSNLSGSITNSSFFTFNNGGIASSNWDGTTFTITAIPEPSTVLAVAGLVGLMLWPSRRRFLKDARSILGLRRPMRDRLAARQA